VRAFNRDKPYDRFLLEQVAGDLLPAADEATRREQLIARLSGARPKVLAEVDEKKMEMDILTSRSIPWTIADGATVGVRAATTTSSTPSRRRTTTASPASS
jgi:hypothetical protein